MAEWKERTRYQSSWGSWYVQVNLDGQVVELKFNDEPKFEELEKKVLEIAESIKNTPAPVQMVEMTVDNAINFLNEKMVEAKPLEVAKITQFVSAKAVEIKPVKPIVKDPIIKEPVVVK